MVGKKSLTALCCASALLLTGAGSAWQRLTTGSRSRRWSRSTVPNQADVDSVVEHYDAAEYKRVEDDGIDHAQRLRHRPRRRPRCKAAGYRIGAHDRGLQHRLDPHGAAPGGPRRGGARRRPRRERHAQGRRQARRASPSSRRRATRSSSARTRSPTWSARRAARTTARFLYVEAYNKSTKVTGTTTVSGPTLALSYAGADGVYSTTAVNMGRFIDTDPTPDDYMYHRQLIRLTRAARHPTSQTIRIATAATAGGAAASVETFPVTEWLGKDLPPHVAGLQEPAVLHALHGPDREPRRPRRAGRGVPEPGVGRQHAGEDLRLPAQVAGDHGRHDRHRRGSAAHARRPAARHHGRDHGRAAGRQRSRSPATAGQTIRATVDGDPVRLDRLHPDAQGPRRRRRCRRSTRARARRSSTGRYTTAGTYTFEVSGFQGDLGDFTFKVEPVHRSAATARPARSC